mgnify:CR=1 FL=1
MANFLRALGQATPAIMGGWKSILEEERLRKQEEREERMEPFKMAREQATTEETTQRTAIGAEDLKRLKRENEQAELNIRPIDVEQNLPRMTGLGINPGDMPQVKNLIGLYMPQDAQGNIMWSVPGNQFREKILPKILLDPRLQETMKASKENAFKTATLLTDKYKKMADELPSNDPKLLKAAEEMNNAVGLAKQAGDFYGHMQSHTLNVEQKQSLYDKATASKAYTPEELLSLEAIVEDYNANEKDMRTELSVIQRKKETIDTTLNEAEILALPPTDPRRKRYIEGRKILEKTPRTDFKDQMIEQLWPTLTDDERKRILGARIDPRELTEKNILDVYANIMTDSNVKKALQPIVDKIIQKTTSGQRKILTMGQLWDDVIKSGSESKGIQLLMQKYGYRKEQAENIIKQGIKAGRIK